LSTTVLSFISGGDSIILVMMVLSRTPVRNGPRVQDVDGGEEGDLW